MSRPAKPLTPVTRSATRLTLAVIGWLSIALGTLGIFLPLLPTTPFVLLASWCFARSSQRFHQWLTAHPQLGLIIDAFEHKQKLPVPIRNRALLVSWAGLTISMCIIQQWWAYVLLTSIGTALTAYLFHLSRRN